MLLEDDIEKKGKRVKREIGEEIEGEERG